MGKTTWWQALATFTLALMLLLSVSCARNNAAPIPAETSQAATAQAAAFCNLRVNGRRIKTPSGQTAVLHGASVPTITEMEASPATSQTRLRALAAAGARVVRLPVDEEELTPTFVPARVGPFVDEANRLGMVVVLGWNGVITAPINTTADDAEDWVRLVIQYLSNRPGVWFEPYAQMDGVPVARQRNIAQRMIDVARGFRANNIIVINNPAWMLSPDGAIPPLTGDNIVYGLSALSGADTYPIEQYPFMLTRWQVDASNLSTQTAEVQQLNLGTIATDTMANELSEFWKANSTDLAACR